MDQFEWPHRRTIVRAGALWVLLVFLAFVLLGPSHWRIGLLGEAVTYLVVGIILCSWRPLRDMIDAIPGPARALPAVLVACLLFGQLVGSTRTTFPFVRFAMYTDEVDPTYVRYRFEAVDSNGERARISPVSLLPTLRNHRMVTLIREILREHDTDADGCGRFGSLARSLGVLFRGAGNSVAKVEMWATEFVVGDSGQAIPEGRGSDVVCSVELDRDAMSAPRSISTSQP